VHVSFCAIQTNHEDVTARCQVTLIKWLESKVDASWEKPIAALKMLKLNMVVKTVEQFLEGEIPRYYIVAIVDARGLGTSTETE